MATAAEGPEEGLVLPVPVWEDGVAADGALQIPRGVDSETASEAGTEVSESETPSNLHVYGANAFPIPSLAQARAQFNGNVWGDVVLASPPGAGIQPFLLMGPGTSEDRDGSGAPQWQRIEEPDTVAQKVARRGRFAHQRVRAVPLRENGLVICGDLAVPPEWAWNPDVDVDQAGLNAHFDLNVLSSGRKPNVIGVQGCTNLVLSVMPSISGGYALAQENVPRESDVLLCLHKSMWRDRLVLQEGMKIIIGSPVTGSCTIEILSITRAMRKRATDVTASHSTNATMRKRRSHSKHSRRKPRHVHFGTATEIDSGQTIKLSPTSASSSAASLQRSQIHRRRRDNSTLGCQTDEDLMATAPIWADIEDEDDLASGSITSLASDGSGKVGPSSKLVYRYTLENDRSRTSTFSPPMEEFAVNTHDSFARNTRPKRDRMLTIGGARNCDIVLPGCPVRIVATISAFDDVFTLMAPNNLSDTFQRGEMLNKSQLIYAHMTAVHLVLDPEKTWGVYDGDTIVVRNLRARDSSLHNCCTGLEVLLRIADPTEKRRIKLNKTNLAEVGVRQVPVTPLAVNKALWFQRAVVTTQPKAVVRQRGRQTLADLAVEVRAPVRVSEWDGSAQWRYGDVEPFAFQGISSVAEATIGASRAMTLSINDSQMSRCHATIFKRGGKKPAYLMEASRSAGRKAVLRLMAASIPPGLGSASTPPHLLLAGEVFRVGASEFKIIGFTKDDLRSSGRVSGRSAGDRATQRGLRVYKARQPLVNDDRESDGGHDRATDPGYDSDGASYHTTGSQGSRRGVSQRFMGGLAKMSARFASTPQSSVGFEGPSGFDHAAAALPMPHDLQDQDEHDQAQAEADEALDWLDEDDEEDEATEVEKERQSVRRAEQRIMEERLAQIETSQFQELQSEADEHVMGKLETPGSIPLVRHRPNQEDPSNRINIVSSYQDEDGGAEMHITNNVDKSFGLARVDEYDDVLEAFGLDEETRAITFPDLDSFMIIQCIKGPLQRRIFLIDQHECTIGGNPSCSIPVPNDPLISPLHCRIVFNTIENHWRLIDCSSRLGTFYRAVAGDDGIFLQPGQRFLIGQSQLRMLGRPKASNNRTLRTIRSVASAAIRRGSFTQLNSASRRTSESSQVKANGGAALLLQKELNKGAPIVDDEAAPAPAGCGCVIS